MVGTAVEVMFPGPLVFERHELVYIYRPAVEQALVFGVDAAAEVVRGGAFSGGIATGHKKD
jgi:hypothetical protein